MNIFSKCIVIKSVNLTLEDKEKLVKPIVFRMNY